MKKDGLFIAFEGIDGCGKSTQIKKFVEYLFNLDKHNHIVLTRNPYKDTNVREVIKEDNDPITQADEIANLFIEDRKNQVNEIILPNLKENHIIISDRFKLSTIAYQAAQGLDIQELIRRHENLPTPDLTFIIDIPTETAIERMNKENRTTHKFEHNPNFSNQVRNNYLKTTELLNEKIIVIDGNKTSEEVFEDIKTKFEKIFLTKKMGKLIVIEGTDCSGKETQTDKVFNALNDKGYDCEKISFPKYGTPTGDIVGDCYLGKNNRLNTGSWFEKADEIDPKIACLYYAADRRSSVEEIRRKLSEGKILISDRYASSNMGHQCAKYNNREDRIKLASWIESLEYDMLELPRPNSTILLYMPLTVANKLKAERDEPAIDAHESSETHLKNAENAYLELIEHYGWTKINCSSNNIDPRSIEDIHNEVLDHVIKTIESTESNEEPPTYQTSSHSS
ncbi:dTMP kinase [Candidatus Pacearchaeota archaeon]|jgi:dTMP kinase|nr:dTMP kinase [Candidatus Pacearchaeota archaeon]|tara:strand:- start:1423 stop:2778 length:1356 start_codon:yes stop_codon:yes gene_type:complete